MQLLHNFERFGIKYFGGIVLKHRQEEFEIIVEIDVCAAVNVVLDLIGSLLHRFIIASQTFFQTIWW